MDVCAYVFDVALTFFDELSPNAYVNDVSAYALTSFSSFSLTIVSAPTLRTPYAYIYVSIVHNCSTPFF